MFFLYISYYAVVRCTLPVDFKYIPLLPEFKLLMVVAPKCLSNGFKFKGDNSFISDCKFDYGLLQTICC